MNARHYKLNKHGNPTRVNSVALWAAWYETANLQIARDVVGKSVVSTVFLGFTIFKGTPELWETRVSGGIMDEAMTRCAGNREQAEAMHHAMIEKITQTQP